MKSKDYALEDFITKSEKLLEDVGNAEELVGEVPTEVEEKINGEIRKRTIESIEKSIDLQINGYAEVTISEDEMTATADFYPPTGGMKPIELDAIVELLSLKEITLGVDWDVIKEAVFKCNIERIQVTDIIIARGSKPVDEIPEQLIMEQQLLKESPGLESESLRVDYKEISPFVLVKEGEVLARLIPKKQGTQGFTVREKAVAYKKAEIPQIKAGENTRIKEDRVVAGCNGRFEYRDRKSVV